MAEISFILTPSCVNFDSGFRYKYVLICLCSVPGILRVFNWGRTFHIVLFLQSTVINLKYILFYVLNYSEWSFRLTTSTFMHGLPKSQAHIIACYKCSFFSVNLKLPHWLTSLRETFHEQISKQNEWATKQVR